MSGYTKLFGSILASTIWRESKETKILWITMLAMANKNGIVEAAEPGLADFSRLTVEETKQALSVLCSPDEFSRTKDHEGRRIEPVDGGWFILNHAKYRAKMNLDERREYLRVKKAESRNRSTNVNRRQQKSTVSTHADADTKTEVHNGKLIDEIACPTCRSVSLKRTPARNGFEGGFWCRPVQGGCNENFPLTYPAIYDQLTPNARKVIDDLKPAASKAGPQHTDARVLIAEAQRRARGPV